MTIYDISKMAGVSIATVSRVLNGNANVRPETKKKVLEVIEKCGYTPNAFARGLGLNSMNTIGILCADSSDLYLAKAVYYIEGYLRNGGYHSILCCTGYDLENKKSCLNLLLNQKVDSVIMVGSNFVEANDRDNDYIREAAAQIPIMLLNADFEYPNVFCTLCDDFRSMQDAALNLIDSGIQDILYLYNSRSYSGRNKLAGYQSAFLLRDLTPSKEYQQYYSGRNDDVEGICRFISELAASGLTFHAVLASEDILAMAALKFARLSNLRIPEDLSVIGYNNSILACCCEPELTTIDNRLEDICQQLVKTLIATLNGNHMPQKTIFSGRLIKRGTTSF
ncbi:MAG: LacI family DNA-binding transcriptional regulator [Lachnospiraceae bacterium]|nr:LacI family DNA-binding transcriptional regulator [Lachnospiraceae bacterium]